MNMHVVQNELARAEVSVLMGVESQIISPPEQQAPYRIGAGQHCGKLPIDKTGYLSH